jgi:hypothetical protein
LHNYAENLVESCNHPEGVDALPFKLFNCITSRRKNVNIPFAMRTRKPMESVIDGKRGCSVNAMYRFQKPTLSEKVLRQ